MRFLGVKTDYDGLVIDPCIPSKWDGFKMQREFRGANYNIEVQNPDHVSKGIKTILVNGSEIESSVVPILEKGKEHSVKVIMG